MKHIVRMLVALLLVGGIGFGVWYFAFRDKPNEVVFKEMTAAINHLDEVEIEYNLKNGSGVETQKEVVSYDKIIEEFISVSQKRNELESASSVAAEARQSIKVAIEELHGHKEKVDGKYILKGPNVYSMESIEYYYSLTATAEKVKNKDKKNLVSKIEAFTNAVDTVVATAKDSLNMYNKKLASNENEINDLANKDVVLLKNMIAKHIAQNDLYFALRDYVNNYVFGSKVSDYKSAMYDIYANEINLVCLNAKITDATGTESVKVDLDVNDRLSLLKSLEARKEVLVKANYIDEGAVEFLNSYNKISKDVAKYLQVSYKVGDEVKNRQLFVQDYESVTDGNYATLASQTGISIELIHDVYNVLKYIIQ